MSNGGVWGARFAAQMATAIALASSSVRPISSRWDMLPCRQLLRGDAEGLILSLVAGYRAKEMAVELRDHLCERSATRFVEPRFTHVFGRGFRGVEAECADTVQLQDGRQEPMGERFGIVPGARQFLRARKVPRGVDDVARPRRGSLHTGPRAGPNDPPDHVADVHDRSDEQDRQEAEPDVVTDGMLLRQAVQPFSKIIPLLDQPTEHTVPFHPLEFRTREHVADHAPQRIGGDCGGRSLQNQRGPSCSLRIWMSKASRRTRKS